jgi:hypothetical protein
MTMSLVNTRSSAHLVRQTESAAMKQPGHLTALFRMCWTGTYLRRNSNDRSQL